MPCLKSPWARIDPSPWPFLTALMFFPLPVSVTIWFWEGPFWPVVFSILCLCAPIGMWVEDIITEGTFCGMHTTPVTSCLATATLLFIFSEAMFFFSFFWAWGHSSWVPSTFIGRHWPPKGIKPIHPLGIPFFNLVSLVWSSGTLNIATGCLRNGNRDSNLCFISSTVFLGVAFEFMQYREYCRAAFCISDGVFGSTFFMLTGFHGFHVLAGLSLLVFNWYRMYAYHFHTGFNVGWMAGVWYWHFVDVIWIVLWFLVYGWGSWGYFVYLVWPPTKPHFGDW